MLSIVCLCANTLNPQNSKDRGISIGKYRENMFCVEDAEGACFMVHLLEKEIVGR